MKARGPGQEMQPSLNAAICSVITVYEKTRGLETLESKIECLTVPDNTKPFPTVTCENDKNKDLSIITFIESMPSGHL